jgi:hypothetical protein
LEIFAGPAVNILPFEGIIFRALAGTFLAVARNRFLANGHTHIGQLKTLVKKGLDRNRLLQQNARILRQ